jgi:hypothetical protein
MWFIDSWAVLDGLAFASKREADSIKADATVFLSVPDLEPVPVGRISTALRAQRGNFQDGFRDDLGNEFGFDNLDQVRELVRRAYLGGGLGPTPAPVEGRPIDPFLREGPIPAEEARSEYSGPSGGEYYRRELDRLKGLGPPSAVHADYSALQYVEKRRPLLESLFKSDDSLAFYPYLRAFGEATVLELVSSRGRRHFSQERDLLGQWLATLWAIGLWDDVTDSWILRFSQIEPVNGSFIYRAWDGRPVLIAPPSSRLKDALFRVRCPLLTSWNRYIQTLSHKLLLPLVVREYFGANKDLPEFIPLLFCSLVIVSNSTLGTPPPARFRNSDRRRLLGRAFLWLTTELPSVELPADVEAHLGQFASSQLHRNPERR